MNNIFFSVAERGNYTSKLVLCFLMTILAFRREVLLVRFLPRRKIMFSCIFLCPIYFGLPRRTNTNKTNILVFIEQKLKDEGKDKRVFVGFHLNKEVFKGFCRSEWGQEFNCLYLEGFKRKEERKYPMHNGIRNN